MARIVRVEGAGKAELEAAMRGIAQSRARVGWLESAKYPSGTPVAYVAAIQEFGSPKNGIPPRPFIRPTIAQRMNAWRAMAKRGASAVLADGAPPSKMLGLVAEQARGDILKSIRNVTNPPLSPVTLVLRQWRKGGVKISGKSVGLAARLIKEGVINPFSVTPTGAKPLVETGYMIKTLVAVVE